MYFRKITNRVEIVQEINGELRRMQRIVEDIIIYGTKRKVSDISDFVKRIFKPDLEISSLEHSEANDKQGNNINIEYIIRLMIISNQRKRKFAKTCQGFIET